MENLPTALFPTDAAPWTPNGPPRSPFSDRRGGRNCRRPDHGPDPPQEHRSRDVHGARPAFAKAYENPGRHRPAPTSRPACPYIFASCRFGPLLKCMVRGLGGQHPRGPQARGRPGVLGPAIMSTAQPDVSSEETRPASRWKSAGVQVIPDEENPGLLQGIFHFVPHYPASKAWMFP